MSVQVEKLEHNMLKATFTETAENFEKAVDASYKKNRGKYKLDGFRKGSAPRALLEKAYGEGVFYEDAANNLMTETYFKSLEEDLKEYEIVSQPQNVDIIEIGKGKEFKFSLEVALKPEVELGKYKGFDVKKETAEVKDEELNGEFERIQEQHSRLETVEGRPVQDKDIAVIDFEGFMDGVPFEGGKGEDHELIIGSHSFIDTFEEQLIGKNIGEEVEVNVTFPEDYHQKDLAGKPALFKVTVKSIKEKKLPELNDEFAEEVSDFDTFAEYKEDVKKKLLERKQKELDAKRRDEIVEKAVENAKMDIPEAMVDSEARRMVDDQARNFQMQGLSMDLYLQYTGSTMEKLIESMKPQALKRIKGSLVLEAVAETEKIEISDEDVNNELQEMAKMYGIDPEKIDGMISDQEKENIRKDLAVRKAAEIIAE